MTKMGGSPFQCFASCHESENMNRIAIGTAQFGLSYGVANQVGQISKSDAAAILNYARHARVNMLDTAISYGDSEVCLGNSGIQDFKIVTKLPSLPDNCSDINSWVSGQLNKSLKRLGVRRIYGLLLHQPNQLLEKNGAALDTAMQKLKEMGLVEKVGISIYSPAELDTLYSNYCFDLVQAPFNLLDNRLYSSGWLTRLKDDGVEIHARSAFLQGLLLIPQNKLPSKFSRWLKVWERWHYWLTDQNISALKACLSFPLNYPEIDRVVLGVDSLRQFLDIIDVLNGKIIDHFPDLKCHDECLINPTNWTRL